MLSELCPVNETGILWGVLSSLRNASLWDCFTKLIAEFVPNCCD